MAANAEKTTPEERMPDLASLPDHALLTPKQVHALTGFAVITLRVWAAKGRGPKVTRIEGVPRYMARHIREWMEATHAEA